MSEKSPIFTAKDGAYQLLGAVVAYSISLQYGASFIFSTIVIPATILNARIDFNETDSNLTDLNYTFHEFIEENSDIIDKDEASWIASILTVGMMVGCPLAGVILDHWGRKLSCIVPSMLFTLSWIMTGLADKDIWMLYVSRALGGVASAIVATGSLIATLLGYSFPWTVAAFILGIIALLTTIALLFVPESPIWLAMQKGEEAERDMKIMKSLQTLYKKKEHQNEAFAALRIVSYDSVDKPDGLKEEVEDWNLDKLRRWKPVFLLIILYTLQRLTGVTVLITYAVQMFEAIGSTETNEWIWTIGLCVTRIVMSMVPIFFNIGRKKLMISSATGMAVSMVAGGVWLHFNGPSIIPTAALLVYTFFANFGVTIIPTVIVSEILPNNLRGSASSFIHLCESVVTFTLAKSFIYMLDGIGLDNVMHFFGFFSMVFIAFVYYFIPETLNRPFEEIAKSLKLQA